MLSSLEGSREDELETLGIIISHGVSWLPARSFLIIVVLQVVAMITHNYFRRWQIRRGNFAVTYNLPLPLYQRTLWILFGGYFSLAVVLNVDQYLPAFLDLIVHNIASVTLRMVWFFAAYIAVFTAHSIGREVVIMCFCLSLPTALAFPAGCWTLLCSGGVNSTCAAVLFALSAFFGRFCAIALLTYVSVQHQSQGRVVWSVLNLILYHIVVGCVICIYAFNIQAEMLLYFLGWLSVLLISCMPFIAAYDFGRISLIWRLSTAPSFELDDERQTDLKTATFYLRDRLHPIPPSLLEYQQILGMGSGGTVWRAVYRGKDVAVKELTFDSLTALAAQNFFREALVTSQIHHPNLVGLIGVIIDPPSLGLVLEYCNKGGMHHYVFSDEECSHDISWPTMLKLLHDVAKGMVVLHANHIVHRDLKFDNILLHETENGILVAKIADFGISRMMVPKRRKHWGQKSSRKMTSLNLTTSIGTLTYIAPELFCSTSARGSYNETVDVYSFGLMLYEAVMRRRAWENIRFYHSMKETLSRKERPSIPDDCPAEYAELIRKCWDDVPTARPSFTTIESTLKDILQKAETIERV